MNLLKKWKEKNFYHLLFEIGIVMIPIIEIFRSFWGDTVQIAGIAIEELLILLWAGVLFLAALGFAFFEKQKKALFGIFVYLAVFGIYALLHGINAAKFNADLIPAARPSFFVECYYLVRMYAVPISLIFSAFLLKLPFTRLAKALRGVLWVIVISIITTDLLGISFTSYADGNVQVAGGFFSWFTLSDTADFALYTAKGPFSSANDMGSILFALTPFAALSAMERKKWYDFLLLFFAGVTSIMVGTKIASLGFFLSLVGVLAVLFIELILKRRPKNHWKTFLVPLLILAICLPLLVVSPGYKLQNRREAEEEAASRPTDNVTEILPSDDQNEETALLKLKQYIEINHWNHFIDPWFFEIYPVLSDGDFWIEVICRPNHENSDSRAFKIDMAKRIVERNENRADVLFGVGHTSGLPYAEKDYIFQYYIFGVLGLVVLMFPFFAAFLYGCFTLFKRLFTKKTLLLQGVPFIAAGAFFITGYLAGHVFDTIICMYFVAFVCGALINSCRHE